MGRPGPGGRLPVLANLRPESERRRLGPPARRVIRRRVERPPCREAHAARAIDGEREASTTRRHICRLLRVTDDEAHVVRAEHIAAEHAHVRERVRRHATRLGRDDARGRRVGHVDAGISRRCRVEGDASARSRRNQSDDASPAHLPLGYRGGGCTLVKAHHSTSSTYGRVADAKPSPYA